LENKYVFRVKQNNTVERIDVLLGLQNADRIEVISGLSEGDLVVVEGNFGLEEGSEIEIKEVIE
jgi:multidrug efflux pump subunit AcrA (membrane-fusion protein)